MVTETDTVGLVPRVLIRDRPGGGVMVDAMIDLGVYSPELVADIEAAVRRERDRRATGVTPSSPVRVLRLVAPAPVESLAV